MNKLQLPQAKLLYAVSEAYRRRKIDQTQKRILKERIITDNVEIYEMLEQTEDELQLQDKLVALVRIADDEVQAVLPIEDEKIIETVQQQQAFSPWGTFLMNKKRREQNHTNPAKGLSIQPQNIES